MENVVFSDKDFLVNYLYKLLDNPTKIKVQKTLYLLFAFYGATYGRLQSNAEGESDFSEQKYPENLFSAKFEAWQYGPVEVDVYNRDKSFSYSKEKLTNAEIDNFFSTNERRNVKGFIQNIVAQTNIIDDFSLVDRTHQDDSWLGVYRSGELHIPMDNSSIVSEYAEKYV